MEEQLICCRTSVKSSVKAPVPYSQPVFQALIKLSKWSFTTEFLERQLLKMGEIYFSLNVSTLSMSNFKLLEKCHFKCLTKE